MPTIRVMRTRVPPPSRGLSLRDAAPPASSFLLPRIYVGQEGGGLFTSPLQPLQDPVLFDEWGAGTLVSRRTNFHCEFFR